MGDVSSGQVRVEPGHKRVRALLGGTVVADTTRPVLVWEKPYYPTYYIPLADVRAELTPQRSPGPGEVAVYDVTVGGRTATGAASRHADPRLHDLIRLRWEAMDEWLEEDEPVYVHPRDPYTRVDVLASSRHVVVVVDGVTVADSRRPTVLFETGLPPRHYLPLADVRTDLLRPSATTTSCPYKGTANYWNLDTGTAVRADLAWIYRTPLPESQKIAGLICFYAEKVDLHLDGQPQQRPQTPFS